MLNEDPSDNSLPLATIAIPTFNRRNYLQIALESALAQTYPNLEIIVLDNASEDDTQSYLNSISDNKVRIIRNDKNIGSINNIQLGFQQAKGDFLLVLSDDDYLYPSFIATAVKDLIQNSKSVFWFSGTDFVDSNGQFLDRLTAPSGEQVALQHIKGWLSGKIPVNFCSTVYRTSVLQKINGFLDTPFMDSAARILCLRYGSAYSCKAVLSCYRRHPLSDTGNSSAERWFNYDQQLFGLIAEVFSGQISELAPLIRGYATRSLLGNLRPGDWAGFIHRLNLLYSKFGWKIWLETKPYEAIIESCFPNIVRDLRQLRGGGRRRQ